MLEYWVEVEFIILGIKLASMCLLCVLMICEMSP